MPLLKNEVPGNQQQKPDALIFRKRKEYTIDIYRRKNAQNQLTWKIFNLTSKEIENEKANKIHFSSVESTKLCWWGCGRKNCSHSLLVGLRIVYFCSLGLRYSSKAFKMSLLLPQSFHFKNFPAQTMKCTKICENVHHSDYINEGSETT